MARKSAAAANVYPVAIPECSDTSAADPSSSIVAVAADRQVEKTVVAAKYEKTDMNDRIPPLQTHIALLYCPKRLP
jgi:hypothetical protein